MKWNMKLDRWDRWNYGSDRFGGSWDDYDRPTISLKKKRRIGTSDTEIKHLLIAWVAISFAFAILLRGYGNILELFLVSLITVGVSFLLHELAHKIVAQHYGLWAEFRMDPTMLVLAIVSAFIGFLFAAPGAVQIFGYYISKKQNGHISLAGPLTNIVLALIFLSLSFNSGFLGLIGTFGFYINILLAAFNLLPFWVLDGKKVWDWNPTVYAIVAIPIFGLAFVVFFGL